MSDEQKAEAALPLHGNTPPTLATQLAADIVRDNPEIAGNSQLLRYILAALRVAIRDEREACASIADSFVPSKTSNHPEISPEQQGALFAIAAVSVNIGDRIRQRPAP